MRLERGTRWGKIQDIVSWHPGITSSGIAELLQVPAWCVTPYMLWFINHRMMTRNGLGRSNDPYRYYEC